MRRTWTASSVSRRKLRVAVTGLGAVEGEPRHAGQVVRHGEVGPRNYVPKPTLREIVRTFAALYSAAIRAFDSCSTAPAIAWPPSTRS